LREREGWRGAERRAKVQIVRNYEHDGIIYEVVTLWECGGEE
jgi:hypothetical protein